MAGEEAEAPLCQAAVKIRPVKAIKDAVM